MDMSDFITIGENLHCTLTVKLGGARTVELSGRGGGVKFKHEGEDRVLPIPADWEKFSPVLAQEKVQHVALGIWQALNGSGDDQKAGEDYLILTAQQEVDNGTNFLDVNVDEYTNDPAERVEIMKWLVTFLSERFETPLSIDSSSKAVLEAGLKCCRKDIGKPMINSISLEREECIELVPAFDAHTVVSAAGRKDLPTTLQGRIDNFREVVAMLDKLDVTRDRMHLDPLVYPISTDPVNGMNLLEAVTAAKNEFGEVKLTGGFSNISFGMPNRKLLNMVFVYLCVDAGAQSGIINPVAMPPAKIGAMDTQSEPFKLTRAVLVGEDMYGMDYIAAFREGRLK